MLFLTKCNTSQFASPIKGRQSLPHPVPQGCRGHLPRGCLLADLSAWVAVQGQCWMSHRELGVGRRSHVQTRHRRWACKLVIACGTGAETQLWPFLHHREQLHQSLWLSTSYSIKLNRCQRSTSNPHSQSVCLNLNKNSHSWPAH